MTAESRRGKIHTGNLSAGHSVSLLTRFLPSLRVIAQLHESHSVKNSFGLLDNFKNPLPVKVTF